MADPLPRVIPCSRIISWIANEPDPPAPAEDTAWHSYRQWASGYVWAVEVLIHGQRVLATRLEEGYDVSGVCRICTGQPPRACVRCRMKGSVLLGGCPLCHLHGYLRRGRGSQTSAGEALFEPWILHCCTRCAREAFLPGRLSAASHWRAEAFSRHAIHLPASRECFSLSVLLGSSLVPLKHTRALRRLAGGHWINAQRAILTILSCMRRLRTEGMHFVTDEIWRDHILPMCSVWWFSPNVHGTAAAPSLSWPALSGPRSPPGPPPAP